MRREFLAEGLRQAKHAGLGGAVCKAADCVRTGAHVSANGGYVDDPAALLGKHGGCDRFAPRKTALKVDRDRLVVLRLADLNERLWLRDAGIVDQHVDAPPFRENAAAVLQYARVVSDAPRLHHRLDPKAPDLLGCVLHLGYESVGQRNRVTA